MIQSSPLPPSETLAWLALNNTTFLVAAPGRIGNVFVVTESGDHYRLAWSAPTIHWQTSGSANRLAPEDDGGSDQVCEGAGMSGAFNPVIHFTNETTDPGVTSDQNMKFSASAAVAFVIVAAMHVSLSFGQASQQGEPTKQEIADAYRSKAGGVGTTLLGMSSERWRMKEIRGWSLHFKRVSEEKGVGILTGHYRAVAKKNGSCAEYQITDTMPLPPVNPQIQPVLVVEPTGVTNCQ